MKKKPFIFVLTALLSAALILLISGCGAENTAVKSRDGEKLKVVTTLFPMYDFTRQIAGDKAEVRLLLPPGVESHAFEPSPRDISDVKKSALFVYTGQFMEPWAEKIIAAAGGNVVIVDSSKGIELMGKELQEGEEDEEDTGGIDPHIWLDPVYAQKMVDNIVEGLVSADAKNGSFYREKGEAYKKKLQELDGKFAQTFSKTKYKKIMYAGHFAFGYFAKRYGLEQISPYSGFAPDAEPTPRRIAELIDNMKKSGSKVIYYEELVDPKVARVIAAQTGAEMLLLHGVHNVSKEEMEAGATYLGIMGDNLEKLKKGLGYVE